MHKMVKDYADKHNVPVKVTKDGYYRIEQGNMIWLSMHGTCKSGMLVVKRFVKWRKEQAKIDASSSCE